MNTKLLLVTALIAVILTSSCKKNEKVILPPSISEVGIEPAEPGAIDGVKVSALVSTEESLKSVKLYYKVSTQSDYTTVDMTQGNDNSYSASIPSFAAGTIIYYYIEAISVTDLSTLYPENAPVSKLDYTVGQSPVLINELFSRGTKANPDWIELYNKSNSPINISGFKIYDSGGLNGTIPKMQIPAGTIIPSKGYFVIVVDDATTANPSGSDFGISSTNGEEIWLESTTGYILDSVNIPAIPVDSESYGRNPDGTSNWQIMTTITRNAPNTDLVPVISGLTIYPENPGSTESVLVSATITDQEGLSSVKLYYNVEGGEYNSLTMTASGNIYSASIPAQYGGSIVNYYLEATDIYALISFAPASAPSTPASYTVTSASAISSFMRNPVNPTTFETVTVSVDITDNLGLSQVLLYYKTGTGNYTSVAMSASGNNYSASIPQFAGGTIVSYYIEVTNTLNQKTYAPANGLSVPASYTVASIVINEIFSRGTALDPDWVELYNLSDNPVDISGYKIYDSGGQTGSKPKMLIPASTTLLAHDYLVIVVDDAATANPSGSNFGLSNTGEDLWLENAGGNVIDHIKFGATAAGESYGRKPDGTANWMVLSPITKGTTNGSK
jgi:hypothetical protein